MIDIIAKIVKYVASAKWALNLVKKILEVVKEVESKIDPGDTSKADKVLKKIDGIIVQIEKVLDMLEKG